MKISVLTLFPEMFDSLKSSILKRAQDNLKIEICLFDIRDYTSDKHQKCDDYSFGGGEGMVMTPLPIYNALMAADPEHLARRIYLSPKGRVFSQSMAQEYSKLEHILLLCGHYEGIDQRIIDYYIDEELSIGDYILTGGELAAQVVIDCTARLIDGVLGNDESNKNETFSEGLLEYPHYTRPRNFNGYEVPEVLLSGDHERIKKWRRQKSEELTAKLKKGK